MNNQKTSVEEAGKQFTVNTAHDILTEFECLSSDGRYVRKNLSAENIIFAMVEYSNRFQQTQSDLVSKWVSVETDEEIPMGNWLFTLEKAIGGEIMHTGNKSEKFIIVAGKFSWDVPKIVAFMTLPTQPQTNK